jgi:hypothetical protein
LSDEAQVAAIVGLYQSERADNMSIGSAVMAVIGGAIAYVGLTSLAGAPNQVFGNASILPFLPLPLWALVIYQSVLIGISMLRASSIRILEERLVEAAGLAASVRSIVGLAGTECVTNITDKGGRWGHRLPMLTTNGFVAVSAIAYTCLCMRHGYADLGRVRFWVLVLVYAALLGLTTLSWWTNIDLSKERERLRGAADTAGPFTDLR